MLGAHLSISESALYAVKDQAGRRARRDLDQLLKRATMEIKKQAAQAQKAASRNVSPGGKS